MLMDVKLKLVVFGFNRDNPTNSYVLLENDNVYVQNQLRLLDIHPSTYEDFAKLCHEKVKSIFGYSGCWIDTLPTQVGCFQSAERSDCVYVVYHLFLPQKEEIKQFGCFWQTLDSLHNFPLEKNTESIIRFSVLHGGKYV